MLIFLTRHPCYFQTFRITKPSPREYLVKNKRTKQKERHIMDSEASRQNLGMSNGFMALLPGRTLLGCTCTCVGSRLLKASRHWLCASVSLCACRATVWRPMSSEWCDVHAGKIIELQPPREDLHWLGLELQLAASPLEMASTGLACILCSHQAMTLLWWFQILKQPHKEEVTTGPDLHRLKVWWLFFGFDGYLKLKIEASYSTCHQQQA